MKAIVWTAYGPPDVLQLTEVPKPAPKGNEVLIRIHATAVTMGDCEIRRLKLPIYFRLPLRMWLGVRRPRGTTIPGTEVAGDIVAVGPLVKRFKEGDQVFGTTGLGLGAYAEYACLPEEPAGGVLALKPVNLTYEQAAAVPLGGIEALHFLKMAGVQRGQRVLICGAGGSIGVIAVQLARYFGAQVTGVDSTEKLDMLRSLGADHVIDYTKEDFTKNGETYDVIFDVVGRSPFARSMRALRPNGHYLLANPGLSQMIRGPWASIRSGKKVVFGAASYKDGGLAFLRELIEAGKIKAVIDRSYTLEQIAEAHRYVEQGHKKGNVIITVRLDNMFENSSGTQHGA